MVTKDIFKKSKNDDVIKRQTVGSLDGHILQDFFEFNEIKAIFRIRPDFRIHYLAFMGKYIVGEHGPLTSMLWNVSKIKTLSWDHWPAECLRIYFF